MLLYMPLYLIYHLYPPDPYTAMTINRKPGTAQYRISSTYIKYILSQRKKLVHRNTKNILCLYLSKSK